LKMVGGFFWGEGRGGGTCLTSHSQSCKTDRTVALTAALAVSAGTQREAGLQMVSGCACEREEEGYRPDISQSKLWN
jgi:hypothetical protein